MNIKLSVIVPIYNIKPEYLDLCVCSILEQDLQEMEVILVNDGSTQLECEKICREAAGRDSRVLYISKENEGVSVARNTGMDRATGEYLMFVDADDWLEKGICRRCYEYVQKQKPDLLLFGYKTNYTNREVTRILAEPMQAKLTGELLQMSILQGNQGLGPIEVGTPWAKLICRKTLEEANVRYVKGLRKGQDTVFSLYLFEACKNVKYLPEAGYHYRVSGASISKRYNPDIVEMMGKTLQEYSRFVEEKNKGMCYQIYLARKYLSVFLNEYFPLYYFHKQNKMSFREKKTKILKMLESEPYRQCLSMAKAVGIEEKIQFFLLRNRQIGILFMVQNLKQIVKDMVIRKYE